LKHLTEFASGLPQVALGGLSRVYTLTDKDFWGYIDYYGVGSLQPSEG